MLIRKLTSQDWSAYKAIRLKSLEDSPQAFESSLVEESQFTPEQWQLRLESTKSSFCLGAFCEQGKLFGIGGFRQGEKLKTSHKAYVWGVYVEPNARGLGVATRLMQGLLDEFYALHHIAILQLTVTANNEQAMALYEALGFRQYGIEKDAIRVLGQSYDEILMSLVKEELY